MTLSQDQFGAIPPTKGQAIRSGVASGFKDVYKMHADLLTDREDDSGGSKLGHAIGIAHVVTSAPFTPLVGALEGVANANDNLRDRSRQIGRRRGIVQKHYEAGKFET